MANKINTFDIDGVIFLEEHDGIYPGPIDFIITGRSYEETEETLAMLERKGIKNKVFFNPERFDDKSRVSSGQHKAKTIIALMEMGYEHGVHFEDDEVQIAEIKKLIPEIRIVHVVSDLVNKENVRHK
jgi:hypothetical protein